MAESRRVTMTKWLIKDALIAMLEETPLSNITITALCEKADVNRVTFYKYYRDPGDVLIDIGDAILEKVTRSGEEELSGEDNKLHHDVRALVDFVAENDKMFKIILVNADDDGFNGRLLKYSLDMYEERYDAGDKEFDHYRYMYMLGGIMGVLRSWVKYDNSASKDKIVDIIYKLINKQFDVKGK